MRLSLTVIYCTLVYLWNISDCVERTTCNYDSALKKNSSEVNLCNCKIKNISSSFFKDSHHILHLNLNNNDMEIISETAFLPLPRLINLTINSNKIAFLPAKAFAHQQRLKSLDLSKNCLQIITKELFYNLTELIELDLNYNNLTVVQTEAFYNNKNLTKLHLDGNKIFELADATFSTLQRLIYLDLSFNFLNKISKNIFGNLTELTELNLNRNKISTIETGAFSTNNKLINLHLEFNQFYSLLDRTFSTLHQLSYLNLCCNYLTIISNHTFYNLTKLTEINLNYNKILEIGNGAFLTNNNLLKLRLGFNQLSDLANGTFAPLNRLKYLDLSNNLLAKIDRRMFSNLTTLNELNLIRNQVRAIEDGAFSSTKSLVYLYLRYNQLTFSNSKDYQVFKNCSNLRLLGLGDNQISCPIQNGSISNVDFISDNITNDQASLSCVANEVNNEISIVKIKSIFIDGSLFFGKEEKITKDLSFTIRVDVTGNPFRCECYHQLIKKYRYQIKNVPEKNICGLEQMKRIKDLCPARCFCTCKLEDQSVVVDCTYRNFTAVPKLILIHQSNFYEVEIHLERNFLTVGPSEEMGYENVTKLYLSHNQITQFFWIPPKIRVLKLDNNNFKELSNKMLDLLKNSWTLQDLSLHNNSWNCDCNTIPLVTLLRNLTKQVNTERIFCTDKRELVYLNKKDLCQVEDYGSLIQMSAIAGLVVLLVVISIVAFYYKYKQTIKVWLYAHDKCLWWTSEDETDDDKIFDIFLCYSHEDEEFVAQTLVPTLEEGPDPYKLCIHVRNWVPGQLIAKQIARSIIQSRRTLVVLSPSFLRSSWGKTEFHFAHSLGMQEGRNRIIVILYEDIDLIKDIDDDIKAYIASYTYIKWGQARFWDNLRYALPHKRRFRETNNIS